MWKEGSKVNFPINYVFHFENIAVGLAKNFLRLLSKNKRHIFSFFIFTKNFIEQHIHHFVPLICVIFTQLHNSIFPQVLQEATIRTEHETIDCFKIGKGVYQACILSPSIFTLYAVYIMSNAGLDESRFPGEIKIVRYTNDITLMAES